MTDIFLTSARSKMDFSGVLEVDNETAYFYLCSTDENGGPKILQSINIGRSFCNGHESDFQILWNNGEDMVAILFGNEVLGVFRLEGGSASDTTFHKMLSSQISADVKSTFQRQ